VPKNGKNSSAPSTKTMVTAARSVLTFWRSQGTQAASADEAPPACAGAALEEVSAALSVFA
jgi:hypothetical protein